MKMYRTSSYSSNIEEIEVERKTEKTVWINGSRSALMSNWRKHFDSFDEAKNHLLKVGNEKVKNAKNRLESSEDFLKKVMSQTQ